MARVMATVCIPCDDRTAGRRANGPSSHPVTSNCPRLCAIRRKSKIKKPLYYILGIGDVGGIADVHPSIHPVFGARPRHRIRNTRGKTGLPARAARPTVMLRGRRWLPRDQLCSRARELRRTGDFSRHHKTPLHCDRATRKKS